MSNLGWYQIITTISKKVGGPKVFMGLLIGGGAVAGGSAVWGTGKLKKFFAEKKEAVNADIIYVCNKDGRSNEGLSFTAGDEFKVLERDGDAALIEKQEEPDIPYFVSAKFLASISNYVSMES